MRYGLALLITAAALVVASTLLATAWGDYDTARRSAQEYLLQQ
jgi:hypothetical protein